MKGKKLWQMILAAICWAIWLERNDRVFNSHAERSYQVYRRAKNFLLFWARRSPECDNDQRGGLLTEWQSAIGLIRPLGLLFFLFFGATSHPFFCPPVSFYILSIKFFSNKKNMSISP